MAKNFESNQPCTCCGLSLSGMVCFHHLLTRKTYPEHQDKSWNKIPVCLAHHNEFHSRGTFRMSIMYTKIEFWMIKNGWVMDEFSGKWIHPLQLKGE